MANEKTLVVRFKALGAKEIPRNLKGIGKESKKAFGQLERSSRKANVGLKAINSSTRAINSTLRQGMGLFGAYIGGRALYEQIRAIARIGMEFQGLHTALKTITGTVAKARSDWNFLVVEAERLGLEVRTMTRSFVQLSAAAQNTGLEGKQVREIFSSVAEAGTVLRLSVDQMNGIFMALYQMISKGKVMSEELRRQLGDRLPGAFKIAAEAMNVTTAELNDMLRRGEVASVDFLPKFAKVLRERFGPGVMEAAQNAYAQMNRLTNQIVYMRKTISESGFLDGLSEGFQALANLLSSNQATEAFSNFGWKLGEGIKTIAKSLDGLAESEEKLHAFLETSKTFAAGVGGALAGKLFKHPLIGAGLAIAEVKTEKNYFSAGAKLANEMVNDAIEGYQFAWEHQKKRWKALRDFFVPPPLHESDNKTLKGGLFIPPSIPLSFTHQPVGWPFESVGDSDMEDKHSPRPIPRSFLYDNDKNEKIEIIRAETEARERLAEAIGKGKEALEEAQLINAQEVALKKVGEIKSSVQYDMVLSLTKRRLKANEEYKQILQDQKEKEKTHIGVIEDLKNRMMELGTEYEVAEKKALAWKTQALAGLDKTKEGYWEFGNQIEEIFDDLINKAYEKSIESSTLWEHQAIAAFKKVAEESRNLESAIIKSFQGMEDAILKFVQTGKLDLSTFMEGMTSDIFRQQINKEITSPIAGFFKKMFTKEKEDEDDGGGVGGLFLKKFHSGGVVGQEVPILARKGETVFTPGQIRLLGDGLKSKSSKINVVINNSIAGAKFDVREKEDENGEENLEIFVDFMENRIADRVSDGIGSMAQVLKNEFGGE